MDRKQVTPIPTDIKQSIWVHCASLGEFEQGRPIIEGLKARYPDQPIVLTFFSPSGYRIRKNYEQVDHVTYLPFDLKSNMLDFVNKIDPILCILVKYELWPNMLYVLQKRSCPTILIGAYFRETHHYFNWFGMPFRRMLHKIDRIFVQDQSSLIRLSSIRYRNAIHAGDPRLDRVQAIAQQAVEYPNIEAFCGKAPIWVWGSTWPEDEQLLHQLLPQLPKGWKIILVPHEVDQKHLDQLSQQFGEHAGLYSQTEDWTAKRICIIDRIGLLAYIYRYAHLAYIGGGFGKGIHSIQEAFIYKIPAIFGPNYTGFREARMLVAMKGAFSVSDSQELEAIWKDLQAGDHYIRAQEAIQGFINQNIGATPKILKVIETDYLPDHSASTSITADPTLTQ
ncbi:MAG: glycosyltransferase N-terminal domain-containing protein [Bacteroidota bacterium]